MGEQLDLSPMLGGEHATTHAVVTARIMQDEFSFPDELGRVVQEKPNGGISFRLSGHWIGQRDGCSGWFVPEHQGHCAHEDFIRFMEFGYWWAYIGVIVEVAIDGYCVVDESVWGVYSDSEDEHLEALIAELLDEIGAHMDERDQHAPTFLSDSAYGAVRRTVEKADPGLLAKEAREKWGK